MSKSTIVSSLCAMAMMVCLANLRRMMRWISVSVASSTLEGLALRFGVGMGKGKGGGGLPARGFVEDEDGAGPDQGLRQAEELFLPMRQL